MANTKTSLSWILLAEVLFCLALGQELITPDRKLYVVKNPSTHELTCISEDDDAALVWNYDLNTSEPFDHFNNFEPVKPMKRISSNTECAVWRSNQCLTKWGDSNNLKTVSSLTNPMAPVVDYRWEGFEEYVAKNQTPMNVLQLNSTDGTVVFSIRGTQNVEIYLCQRGEFRTSFCYLIRLAVDGKYSVITRCQPEGRRCREETRRAIHESAILDAHEWRTFRLQLIGSEQKIKVFRDTDENAFLEGNLRDSRSINSIWISSGPVARIRFHTYNYILFTKANVPSTTLEFDWPDNYFCINMLVSICPSCRLIVGLTGDDFAHTDNSKSITGDEQFHQSGLRTWQTVKLNLSSSSSSTGRLKLYSIPGLIGGNHEVMWWAIDNLRLCEPNDEMRKSTITLPLLDCTRTGLNIKCQKLLRDETVVADLYNRPSFQNTGRFGEYIQRFIESLPRNNTAECNDASGKYSKEKTVIRKIRSVRCFDVIPRKTSFELQITSDFPVCREEGPYFVRVKDLQHHQRTASQTCIRFPCAYVASPLKPFNEYIVIVMAPWGIMDLYEIVKTLESAPGGIRNLSFESTSATSVTGKWNPPDQVNGIIRNYTVSIKRVELLGCRDFKKPSPPVPEIIKNVTGTMASFSDLHPYARYRFQVIANTIEPGPSESKEFETAQLNIPTSNVSHLRLINESRLAWDSPTDCTTVTGPTKITKLIFWGVSEWAKKESKEEITAYKTLDLIKLKLLPYTEYRICAYFVRHYSGQENSSNCQPYLWRTKPAASPAVKNIEIYEADALGRTISVEWEPPYPPTGKIESYQMSIINEKKMMTSWSIEVSALKMCRQSRVCVESWSLPSNISVNDNLTIFARNANVTEDGATSSRWFKLDDLYNKAPGQPEQLKVTPREYGTVTLQWSHPSFTPTKIVRFQIQANCSRTNLTTNPCKDILPIYYDITNPEEKRKSYSTELNLLTSTEYRLHVISLNYRNKTSVPITKNVSTSGSVTFACKDELKVINAIDVVALEIPAVLNATRDTTIVIKVEGLSLCAPNSSRNGSSSKNKTNVMTDWDAVKYSVNRSQPVNFTFEVNKYYGVEQNCSFQHEETYIFNAILEDPGLEEPLILKTPRFTFTEQKPSEKQSQTWLVIISIPVICLLLLILFIFYRKHKKTKMQTNDSQGVSSDLRRSIHFNSRVQSSDAQHLPSDPGHTTSSKNLDGQTSCKRNVPLEPPYMIPRNPSEQPSHPQDIALDPLYMNTLDNSSYRRDASLDPEYSTILDDSREETSYAQDILLAPVYMNILNNSREQKRHAQDTP